MYPSLQAQNMTQTHFQKSLPPSREMEAALIDLKQAVPSISSFKPHLNTFQCYLSLIVNKKLSLPIKIVFLRNFPQERPLIFITQWINHPMVNRNSCQIEYQSQFKWNPTIKLSVLVKTIQQVFNQTPPTYDSELDRAIQSLDNFSRQVESLRTKPAGTQPPPIPTINLENTLNTFEYQQNLQAQCEQKASLYTMTAQQYNENISRVRVMSEKFSKGKIISDMEKQIEAEAQHSQGGSLDQILQSYLKKKKNLHRIKILKELYQES